MDFRLDRLATLYLVSPLMRLASHERRSIPILMYHSIAEEDESGTPAYYRTTTSPVAFATQMEYLHRNGYQTCTPAQAVEFLKADPGSIDKKVAITFDDGYDNFYEAAFPILSRFGFTATVYLPTAYIGEKALQFKGRDCLTWSRVRELQDGGISFGSHTETHPQLRHLDNDDIETEVVNSKKTIEQKTGRVVESFAYPYAFPQMEANFRKILREILQQAGYSNGVCTIVGRVGGGSDRLFMERLPVNACDDRALFQAKLAGAYDWISSCQAAVKTAKHIAAGRS